MRGSGKTPPEVPYNVCLLVCLFVVLSTEGLLDLPREAIGSYGSNWFSRRVRTRTTKETCCHM